MSGVSGVGGGNQVCNAERVISGGNHCAPRQARAIDPYGCDRFESNSGHDCERGGGIEDVLGKLAKHGMQVAMSPLNFVSSFVSSLFGGDKGGGGGGGLGSGLGGMLGGLVQNLLGGLFGGK
jgi:hypothetical protein